MLIDNGQTEQEWTWQTLALNPQEFSRTSDIDEREMDSPSLAKSSLLVCSVECVVHQTKQEIDSVFQDKSSSITCFK